MQISSLNLTSAISPQLRQDDANVVLNKRSEPVIEPTATQTEDAVKALDPKELANQVEDAVKKINDTIKLLNQGIGLEFGMDEDTNIRLVKLIDTKSKEVLRQFPSEEVINIAKALDKLQGLLVRDKA
ncbi:flagellar protein FlaG [Chitinibacter sp. GC72]|uniref:flagellar protein FlaG n=1 Tax=Chitinibacter sp. GC72 TaxID=1526917 RepID=UPI0012FCF0CC|nr:flagellar protein FlaG [Chitinibacter sp. GC72]